MSLHVRFSNKNEYIDPIVYEEEEDELIKTHGQNKEEYQAIRKKRLERGGRRLKNRKPFDISSMNGSINESSCSSSKPYQTGSVTPCQQSMHFVSSFVDQLNKENPLKKKIPRRNEMHPKKLNDAEIELKTNNTQEELNKDQKVPESIKRIECKELNSFFLKIKKKKKNIKKVRRVPLLSCDIFKIKKEKVSQKNDPAVEVKKENEFTVDSEKILETDIGNIETEIDKEINQIEQIRKRKTSSSSTTLKPENESLPAENSSLSLKCESESPGNSNGSDTPWLNSSGDFSVVLDKTKSEFKNVGDLSVDRLEHDLSELTCRLAQKKKELTLKINDHSKKVLKESTDPSISVAVTKCNGSDLVSQSYKQKCKQYRSIQNTYELNKGRIPKVSLRNHQREIQTRKKEYPIEVLQVAVYNLELEVKHMTEVLEKKKKNSSIDEQL